MRTFLGMSLVAAASVTVPAVAGAGRAHGAPLPNAAFDGKGATGSQRNAKAVEDAPSGLVPVLGARRRPAPELGLHKCQVPDIQESLLCGVLWVPENRSSQGGRKLPIKIIVVPARNRASQEGPIFGFGGGPGQTATNAAANYVDDWRRTDHDVVMVDHRGTGDGHRLDCPKLVSDEEPQAYLRPPLSAELGLSCRELLQTRFDLAQYTTLAAAEDLDDVRRALGYERINIDTSSFGAYLALVYMREFPGRVRSAFLGSAVTFETRVPLHMAEDAQYALDMTLHDCEVDKSCHTAFPTARDDFYKTLIELRNRPGDALIKSPKTGAPVHVKVTADAFADAVRVMLYNEAAGRTLPFLLRKAREGDLSPFATVALQSNRGLYDTIRFGLFLSVTCSEFVARIHPDEIAAATEGTFIGDARVRSQIAACSHWPKSALPQDFFRDFVSPTPVVLSSYSLDPTVASRWLESAKKMLPNSLVIMTFGGHSANNACTDKVARQLFRAAAVEGLDLSCIPEVTPLQFQLEDKSDNSTK